MTLNGYDISAYQGNLNPATVPGDFVIIKVTGGEGVLNQNWRAQFDAARAAGKLVGLYHFARDGYTSATAAGEAAWFIQNAGPVLDGTVVVYLDWEGDNVGDVAYAKAWLDIVTAQTGVKPLIYLSYATITSYDWSSVANANYGLWESAYVLGYQKIYGYVPPAGLAPIPYWNTLAEWQYTSSGEIPGWPNDLDLDIFYGDATTWAAYAAKNGVISAATSVTPLEEDVPLTQADADLVARTIINYPLARQGAGQSGSTNPGAVFSWFDASVSGIVATIRANAGQVSLTDAQVTTLAAQLKSELPAATLDLLKSKL